MPASSKDEAQILGVWWKEYGYYILFTIIMFIAFSFGWRYWQRTQIGNQEQASLLYIHLLESAAQQQESKTKLYGERLLKDHAHSVYTSFAALLLAKDAVHSGDLQLAVARLKLAISNAPSKQIKQLTRIRAARVLIAAKEPDKALELLAKIDDKTYTAAISETSGDALMALGKKEQAERAYRQAEQYLEQNKQLTGPLLRMKLQQF